MNSILSEGMFDIVFLGAAVPIGMKLMNFTGNFSHLFDIKSLIDLTEASFAKQSKELVLFDFDPVGDSDLRVDFSIFGMFLFEKKFILFYMQHFLLVESFQNFLVVGLFPGQKISLGGDRIFPFFGILLVLFVCFFRLLFLFLELLLLLIDSFDLFFDLPDFDPVDPYFLTLFVGNVLSQPDLVVADPLSHFVPLHSVAFDDVLKHLLFAVGEQFLFYFKFFFQ